MAPIRDWTGAITFFPTSPHKIRRSVKYGSVENMWG